MRIWVPFESMAATAIYTNHVQLLKLTLITVFSLAASVLVHKKSSAVTRTAFLASLQLNSV